MQSQVLSFRYSNCLQDVSYFKRALVREISFVSHKEGLVSKCSAIYRFAYGQ